MNHSKLLAVAFLISCITSCGGGGGGGNSSANPQASDAIALVTDLSSVETISLSDSASSTTTTASIKKGFWDSILDGILPSAWATTYKTNNVFAFDSNGNAITNPLKSKVNLFISAATVDPTGTYVYLGIDSHMNSKLFSDFAALPRNTCSIYRIKKNANEVKCLATSDNIDINGESLGKNILFDKNSNAFFLGRYNASAYGTAGSEKTRLLKINSATGSITAVRDTNGWWSTKFAQAKNGNIFMTEYSMGSGAVQQKKIFLNTTTNAISEVSLSSTVSEIGASDGGEIFLMAACNIYSLNQSSLTTSRLNTTDFSACSGSNFIKFSNNASTGLFALKSNGDVYNVNMTVDAPISNVGSYLNSFKNKNDISDIEYPAMISRNGYLVTKGSTNGTQQICVVNENTLSKRCETFTSSGATSILSMTIVNNSVIVFFSTGSSYKQASFDVTNNTSSITVSDSTAGDGGLVIATSLRAPVTLAASTASISATATDSKSTLTVSNQQESFTLLKLTFDAPAQLLDLSQLVVKDSSNNVLTIESSLVGDGFIVWIKVKDATLSNTLKYKLFPNGTQLSIELPATLTLPGLLLDGSITTRSISLTVSST